METHESNCRQAAELTLERNCASPDKTLLLQYLSTATLFFIIIIPYTAFHLRIQFSQLSVLEITIQADLLLTDLRPGIFLTTQIFLSSTKCLKIKQNAEINAINWCMC